MALTPEELKRIREAKGKKGHPREQPVNELVETEIEVEVEESIVDALTRPIEREVGGVRGPKPGPKQKTEELLESVHQEAIAHTIKYDVDMQKKVMAGAASHVLSELEVRHQEQKKKVQDATYNAIEDAANNYGISSGRPMWQLKMAQAGSAFWFVIWFVISTVTFTPVIFFLKMIGVQVKSAKLKWMFTLLMYLMVMFLLFVLISVAIDWKWWSGRIPTPSVVTE